jgi:hypothetical protein
MQESFEKGNECFAPGCDEGAELAVVTITDFLGGITMELCAKHSEVIAPELMRMYHFARQRWVEEREIAQREFDARQEREAIEAEERWLAYKAELKPKLLSALDGGNDDNLRELLIDLTRNAGRFTDVPPF